MKRQRGAAVVVTGVVVLLAHTGCAPADSASPSESDVEVSREEQHDAFEQAMQSCLAEHGFDYEPQPISEFTVAVNGSSDEDFVHQYGYGVAASFLENVAESTEDEKAWADAELTEEESRARHAAMASEGGCVDKAMAAMPDRPNEGIVLDDETRVLVEEAKSQMAADERTIEAMAQWAECMNLKGYDFTSRDDGPRAASQALDEWIAQDDAAYLDGTPNSHTERTQSLEMLVEDERRVATDDIECAGDIQPILDELELEYMAPIKEEAASLDE